MKIEKFRVIECIRQYIIVSDKYLENFPKKELEMLNMIKTNSYLALEIAYYANSLEDIEEKIRQLNLLLAKVRVIDFLLDVSQEKEYINKKQYLKLLARLGDIEKFTLGWLEKARSDRVVEQKNI